MRTTEDSTSMRWVPAGIRVRSLTGNVRFVARGTGLALAGARTVTHRSEAPAPRGLRLVLAFGLSFTAGGVGCDSPTTVSQTAPPTAMPETTAASVFVAFDTTATCALALGGEVGWAPLSPNQLANAPMTLGEARGTARLATHPAFGTAWVDLAGAESCLLDVWAPTPLSVPPDAVYLRLGEGDCMQIDPILGGAMDVSESPYRISAVLPVMVSVEGAPPSVVEAVRMDAESGRQRLTLRRQDFDLCAAAEPAEAQSEPLMVVTLPRAGKYGPSPLARGSVRTAETAAQSPRPLTLELSVPRRLGRLMRQALIPAGGTESEAAVRVDVSLADTQRTESGLVASRVQGKKTIFPSPESQVAAAHAGAARVAAQWAALEAQFPDERSAAYLEQAQGRARRKASEFEALRALEGPAYGPRETFEGPGLVRSGTVSVDLPAGEAPGFGVVAEVELLALPQSLRRAGSARAEFDKQTVARVGAVLDLVTYLRPLLSPQPGAIRVAAPASAGLISRVGRLAGGVPVAMIASHTERRLDTLASPAVDFELQLPAEQRCLTFAAETLERTGSLRVSLGHVGTTGFTVLHSRSTERGGAGLEVCWRPEQSPVTLRVESGHRPFVVGVFATGEGVRAEHVLGSLATPENNPWTDDPLKLDATLGLPDPGHPRLAETTTTTSGDTPQ